MVLCTEVLWTPTDSKLFLEFLADENEPATIWIYTLEQLREPGHCCCSPGTAICTLVVQWPLLGCL